MSESSASGAGRENGGSKCRYVYGISTNNTAVPLVQNIHPLNSNVIIKGAFLRPTNGQVVPANAHAMSAAMFSPHFNTADMYLLGKKGGMETLTVVTWPRESKSYRVIPNIKNYTMDGTCVKVAKGVCLVSLEVNGMPVKVCDFLHYCNVTALVDMGRIRKSVDSVWRGDVVIHEPCPSYDEGQLRRVLLLIDTIESTPAAVPHLVVIADAATLEEPQQHNSDSREAARLRRMDRIMSFPCEDISNNKSNSPVQKRQLDESDADTFATKFSKMTLAREPGNSGSGTLLADPAMCSVSMGAGREGGGSGALPLLMLPMHSLTACPSQPDTPTYSNSTDPLIMAARSVQTAISPATSMELEAMLQQLPGASELETPQPAAAFTSHSSGYSSNAMALPERQGFAGATVFVASNKPTPWQQSMVSTITTETAMVLPDTPSYMPMQPMQPMQSTGRSYMAEVNAYTGGMGAQQAPFSAHSLLDRSTDVHINSLPCVPGGCGGGLTAMTLAGAADSNNADASAHSNSTNFMINNNASSGAMNVVVNTRDSITMSQLGDLDFSPPHSWSQSLLYDSLENIAMGAILPLE